MQIVRLERRRTRPPRIRVHRDDGTTLEVSDEVASKFRLSAGDDVDERRWEEIREAHQRIEARRLAIGYLSYRPRSSQEVVRHLVGKKVPPEIAEATAERLRGLKMIDDASFARMYVRDRLRRAGAGPALLRELLVRKGIARRVAETVIDELLPGDEQRAAALRVAKQRLQRLSSRRESPERSRQRIYDLLLRRGFTGEVARGTLRQLKF
ncbi:MAG: RecX family transcriptional regulator [Bacteroidetes bacterium]|nr:RecX family transcriptional regulator [Bacteroidota bacterium]